jgi:murein DD-endopeptidase MepM/ murein hydrolase activator NlpD
VCTDRPAIQQLAEPTGVQAVARRFNALPDDLDLEAALSACGAPGLLYSHQFYAAASVQAAAALIAIELVQHDERLAESSPRAVAAIQTQIVAPPAANLPDIQDQPRTGSYDDLPRLPRLTLKRVAAALGTVLGLGAVTAVAIAPASDVVLPSLSVITEQVALLPASLPGDQPTSSAPRFNQTEIINRGETLSSLLARLGADDPDLIRFAASDRVGKRLLQLQPGRTVLAEVDATGVIRRLQYRHGNLEIDGKAPLRVTIERIDGRLVASEAPVPLERSLEVKAAEIRTTLFASTDAAGIPDSIATRAADILSNSIDLRRDLRRGAQLRVVYESLREADSLDLPVPGRILALELVSGNIRHEAVWFEHDDGRGAYYNFAGQSLVRSFLREPIQFTRITSGFSSARLHPLFNNVRAHTGTDFAAPVGTKVRTVADGIVDYAGYNGGYGRTVIVSHPGQITTLYAHLNGFAEGITKGARVSQGQVIGTVGMTGWTTGPHLHYEFRINGRHVDPMRATLPEGRKLSMSERMRFAPLSSLYRERMAQIDQTAVSVARFE